MGRSTQGELSQDRRGQPSRDPVLSSKPFPDAAAVGREPTPAPGSWVWMVRARAGAGSQAIQRAHRKGTLDAQIVEGDDEGGSADSEFLRCPGGRTRDYPAGRSILDADEQWDS